MCITAMLKDRTSTVLECQLSTRDQSDCDSSHQYIEVVPVPVLFIKTAVCVLDLITVIQVLNNTCFQLAVYSQWFVACCCLFSFRAL